MRQTLDLAGRWRFALDPQDRGLAASWFQQQLPEHVQLPGTTDTNARGEPEPVQSTRLSRRHAYQGPAWYQRDVRIPARWAGRRCELSLERTKAATVWVDERQAGGGDAVSCAQRYDLTPLLSPGEHRLTVRVENGPCLPVGGHAVAPDTQTDWNGILGGIVLTCTPRVWLEDLQVYPDARHRRVRVRLRLGNAGAGAVTGRLTLAVRAEDGDELRGPLVLACRCGAAGGEVAAELDLGPEARLWDEFTPALYHLEASLRTAAGGDTRTCPFGLRDFAAAGTHFGINGRTAFLRGKHDGCVFPLTGCPPMDLDSWMEVFLRARQYGINHYRFHSWCPPEAAFAAADRLGLYLQVELPHWRGRFTEPARHAYLLAEGRRILDAYGNHPSFVLMALGNELGDAAADLAAAVAQLRAHDGRHLYAQGSNNRFVRPEPAEGDDFWVTGQTSGNWTGEGTRTRFGAAVRGAFDRHDRGHVNNAPPSTEVDYRGALAGLSLPVIGHEVGQYRVHPDPAEAARYTGVLRAANLEELGERLRAQGLAAQAPEFQQASGALAVRCYREEIEAALRTPGFGGFQLLDLQDYPGQGTATVGILDALLSSKGLIPAPAWRAFCCETVPLLRFGRYTWCADETFRARAQVAHYGPGPLRARPCWRLRDGGGAVLAEGVLPTTVVPTGEVWPLGEVAVDLAGLDLLSPGVPGGPVPGRSLQLELALPQTPYANAYPLWVYPAGVPLGVPPGVRVGTQLDERLLAALAAGARVLLLPPPEALGPTVPGAFQPDFWSFAIFGRHGSPGTLGILCRPEHPALAGFPTATHGDWQWWHLVRHAPASVLDGAPAELRPIIQTIDAPERCHRLGLLWECQVAGGGRLLVCNLPLSDLLHLPQARQLLSGLLTYAASARFLPEVELAPALLRRFIPGVAGKST